jgi:sugar phosphate isomerase/epimerase
MELGWCASFANAQKVKDIGYDYLEVPLAGFGLLDDASLLEAKRAVAATPIPLTVFNWFYPMDFRIVGEAVDAPKIKAYLSRAAELMHHADARSAVLGSAWSRNVEPGYPRGRAEEQILESYHWVADAFAGSGVVVGIEAQNRKEANIILSLAEAVHYAKTVNRPEIRVMADFYHMDEEEEPLSDVKTYADWIVHVQLADSGRRNPGTGAYDYDNFFRYLKEGGYAGTVSVECMIEIAEGEMRRSLELLRRYWPAVSGSQP